MSIFKGFDELCGCAYKAINDGNVCSVCLKYAKYMRFGNDWECTFEARCEIRMVKFRYELEMILYNCNAN